jgi:hypothetical protein
MRGLSPHSVVEIAREGFRKIGEPLCPFVALLSPLASIETSAIQDDEMLPATMVGEVPGWAWTFTRARDAGLCRRFCSETARLPAGFAITSQQDIG